MFGKEERDKDGVLNVALCALSTPVLLVTDSPAQILLSKAGGIAGPFLWCPPVLTQQIASWSKAPLKEARHLVSGADQCGHCQQLRSGVTLPEAWAGADSYMRKACLQLNECSYAGSEHPSWGYDWSVNVAQPVFNDG